MKSIKRYWNERREESKWTLKLFGCVSLLWWLQAIWYDDALLLFGVWLIIMGSYFGHALCMAMVHSRQNPTPKAPGSILKAVALITSLAVAQANTAEFPPPLVETEASHEPVYSLYLSGPLDEPHPPGLILPVVCVGVGIVGVGWIGLRIISACLNIQYRQATNPANAFLVAAAPAGGTQPVTGEPCNCQTLPEGQPLPLELQYSPDGVNSWETISVGMIAGEQQFVPRNGRWRIKQLRIEARRDSMIVPPGTLMMSRNLKDWHVISISDEIQTVVPEPNTFYRIQ